MAQSWNSSLLPWQNTAITWKQRVSAMPWNDITQPWKDDPDGSASTTDDDYAAWVAAVTF